MKPKKVCPKCDNARVYKQSVRINGHTTSIMLPCPRCNHRAYKRAIKGMK